MSPRKLVPGIVAIAASALVLASVSSGVAGCSQTPTSVPVRTFERAQRMDVACLRLFDPANNYAPVEPQGRPQEECVPVPPNVDGSSFVKQLFALVTQSTRGELAVVNLSAGFLQDLSRATPGINFLPVGALPTDVATTPDGKMAFVGSAEPNKAAIYGIPMRRILGDTEGFPRDPEPISLASWPVCGLPQAPGALVVVPRHAAPAAVTPDAGPTDADAGDGGDGGDGGDAGASDGGSDAGAAAADLPSPYELIAILPGDRRNTAKIVSIDPRPFRRGGLRRLPPVPPETVGKPDYASDHLANEPATLADGPVLEPGSLAACPIISAIELVGASAVPGSFNANTAWDDGVKYVDGGVDLTCLRPAAGTRCGPAPCCGQTSPTPGPDAGAAGSDAGTGVADAGGCEPLGTHDAGGPIALDLGALDPPHIVSVARDDQLLYVADDAVPLIHVIDLSVPGALHERLPLLATSVDDPARVVSVKDLALSPPTRDYSRFLYAVDRVQGSLMVFDVTDPATPNRTPLLRPHPELNPFQPADRIAFNSPVVAVAFARHDIPLAQIDGVPMPSAASGVLCNPNPRIDSNPRADLGFYYRANRSDPGQDVLGPRRLRGIFGFATLANGQVITLDVDDWDSPCRRPQDMSKPISDIAPAQVASGAGPYEAPLASDLSVTNEAFFPMSAPHTLRSEVLVTNDPTAGNQLPRIEGVPTVAANGVILPQTGPGSESTPLLDVKFAFEDPRAHIDEDWTAVYEGEIPGFDGLPGDISTPDHYRSLVLAQPQAQFCSKGVEDWALGIERTNAIGAELASKGKALPARADRLMTDYIQLTEDLLDPSDDYWGLREDPNDPDQCWDPQLSTAASRQDACVRTFGSASEQNPQRDFPILEAYDDRLVLGRFYVTPEGRREVVYKDTGKANADILKLMRCCFHRQVRFKVRTGQLWSVVGKSVGGGPGVGFLSHLQADETGRCVPSCTPRESLLNGRVPTTPNGTTGFDRNSPLAMRNPMFAITMFGGPSGATPARDTIYSFSTRGQFRTLFVAIGGASTSVNPQSMHFIETLGQMAVVDGASQGLVLIDLRAVTVARAPYF